MADFQQSLWHFYTILLGKMPYLLVSVIATSTFAYAYGDMDFLYRSALEKK